MKTPVTRFALATALLAVLAASPSLTAQTGPRGPQTLFGPAFGPGPNARPQPNTAPAVAVNNSVTRWNQIAIDASGLDHTPVATGETRTYGEQLGPCRASRAIAMTQVAVFEAVNALAPRYQSAHGIARAAAGTSRSAAIAQAARDTLAALFPSQTPRFDTFLAEDLARIADGAAKTRGIALGRATAAAVVASRANDGSAQTEALVGVDYFPKAEAGKWQQDPISLSPVALGLHWGKVKPFVMTSGDQFRLPPPPALDSVEHAQAYVEVKRLGGDGTHTPTERGAEGTEIGTFWAYDGTPSLCAPPRLYNQIARTIAAARRTDETELARLLALLNVAMADTAIAGWETKWFYEVERPITAIRRAEADGNIDTVADTTFHPLGAPASNLSGPNFTPPFPAYPSGHAAFGGALFQTLRRFYGTDAIAFSFVSDEYNGVTTDNSGAVRPRVERSFASLSQAEFENAYSRVYLGIHWLYDATGGIEQGNNVSNHVFDRLYRPLASARR